MQSVHGVSLAFYLQWNPKILHLIKQCDLIWCLRCTVLAISINRQACKKQTLFHFQFKWRSYWLLLKCLLFPSFSDHSTCSAPTPNPNTSPPPVLSKYHSQFLFSFQNWPHEMKATYAKITKIHKSSAQASSRDTLAYGTNNHFICKKCTRSARHTALPIHEEFMMNIC